MKKIKNESVGNYGLLLTKSGVLLMTTALLCLISLNSKAQGNTSYDNNNEGISGTYNTALGIRALWSNTSGRHNTGIGYYSLINNIGSYNTSTGSFALYSNTTGGHNTANGRRALYSNTTGFFNTAQGNEALFSNTTGYFNTAGGYHALYSNTSGNSNTGSGFQALFSNTTGSNNTASGYQALRLNTTGVNNSANGNEALYSNTSGSNNTANGYKALYFNTTGVNNSASGHKALYSNTTGDNNSASGYEALFLNTTGYRNTANGFRALYSNTTGFSNTAQGNEALFSNTTGYFNTASGYHALHSNTTAFLNTANGFRALLRNSTGHFNTANGAGALQRNRDGYYNTAGGYHALYSNTTGSNNTAIGSYSLIDNTEGEKNTAFGQHALNKNITGSGNTAIGFSAGPGTIIQIENSTALGADATTTASNQVRIGNNAVTDIGGYANWSNLSDARFKNDVNDTKQASGLAFINKLRPVSYKVNNTKLNQFLARDKKAEDTIAKVAVADDKTIRTGFIAQEVAGLVNELGIEFDGVVIPQNKYSTYAIRYASFVVPLVKAVQELSANNDELRNEIENLKRLVQDTVSSNDESPLLKTLPDHNNTKLYQNVPNPFNQETSIVVDLPQKVQTAQILIYDLQGTELGVHPIKDRGNTSVKIKAFDYPSGMYLYALIADGQVIDTKRMILTK